jgi:hypothetical protein
MTKHSANKIATVLFWHAVDIVFYGIALKFLAEWYVTPIFHTARVTWAGAFGLVLVARLLVQKHDGEPPAITIQALIEEAVVPFLFVEAGYAIMHFLGP